ncbi:hypothetical protein [Rubrobacter radiotolerans]|uniref:Uncharacterized protein n=1 Tax=Rubrobacter radiotolerans TaxID=42256 RepID=A0AB35T8T6_RUBRA|nr:hypothetical protein [Rubrobacter radiotolerans]MDX5894653.1 hypothetical protein [Rubrobacter radiotolerans]
MVLCFRDLYLAGFDVVAGRFAGTDFFRITALISFAVVVPAWLLARRHYGRMYSYSSAGEISSPPSTASFCSSGSSACSRP